MKEGEKIKRRNARIEKVMSGDKEIEKRKEKRKKIR